MILSIVYVGEKFVVTLTKEHRPRVWEGLQVAEEM